jgi:hypothetical protein
MLAVYVAVVYIECGGWSPIFYRKAVERFHGPVDGCRVRQADKEGADIGAMTGPLALGRAALVLRSNITLPGCMVFSRVI